MKKLVYEMLTVQRESIAQQVTLFGIRLTQPLTGERFEIADLSVNAAKVRWFLDLIERNDVTLDEIESVVDNAFWHKDRF